MDWRRAARRVIVGSQGQIEPSSADDSEALDPGFWQLVERVRPYTMTSDDKLYALYGAIQHIVRTGVRGDVVECGVWRGGSSMLAALTFAQAGDEGRAIWLYDTFEGMPPPSARDTDRFGTQAKEVLGQFERAPGLNNPWAYATLQDVQQNMDRTAYANVRLVPGMVEDTIPAQAPDRISLLRLDTDWYESTRHELNHLYPRLEPGGILLLDDYGWWSGARQAVDEYFAETPIFLVRVGTEGARIAVKP
jgi:O-methyltransferase